MTTVKTVESPLLPFLTLPLACTSWWFPDWISEQNGVMQPLGDRDGDVTSRTPARFPLFHLAGGHGRR